jgi:phosphoenolpyruvate carboxykinase (GTP)
MAMLPFCGYDMGRYVQHWLDMGKKVTNPPAIFHVNWFRKDENGKFIWPGFGENLRVLEWVIERACGEAEAVESPIGYMPKPEDIHLEGSEVTEETLASKLLNIDKECWSNEVKDQQSIFDIIGGTMPKEIHDEREALSERIEKM